jgi:hypothetical protein
MRNRSLLTLALILIALLALGLVASGVALSQEPSPVRATATPAALPEGYEVRAPADPEALPDLVVQSVRLFPPNPYVNQDALVQVTIKNVGTADVEATNNFFLDLYINPPTDNLSGIPGDYDWGVQGYLMGVGESATFEVVLEDVFTDTASYNLWAQVDTPFLPDETFPLGHVTESNEDNNILGPKYVTVRTHYSWVEKDHVDFFSNMASTLDVVPRVGTVGIVTNTPGLELTGDSALVLGIFDEPPPMASWGTSDSTDDYNMIEPDTRLNDVTETDQRFPFVHAATPPGGIPGEDDLVVAVWEDGRNGPTFGRDIFLRWSDDGGQTWNVPDPEEIKDRVNDDDGYADQKNAAVAVAPSGDIVVVWQDQRAGNYDIYAQMFRYVGATGELVRCHKNGLCDPLDPCDPMMIDCNVRVDTGAADQDQILPDIAVDEEGNFYVAWQDQRNNNDDIFAVRSYWDGANLAWATDARIHDDPSSTKQSSAWLKLD